MEINVKESLIIHNSYFLPHFHRLCVQSHNSGCSKIFCSNIWA